MYVYKYINPITELVSFKARDSTRNGDPERIQGNTHTHFLKSRTRFSPYYITYLLCLKRIQYSLLASRSCFCLEEGRNRRHRVLGVKS